ncbi:hypothetical protein [Scardovia wiggsiae]
MTDGTIQTSGEAAAVTAEMKKGLDGYTDFSPGKTQRGGYRQRSRKA